MRKVAHRSRRKYISGGVEDKNIKETETLNKIAEIKKQISDLGTLYKETDHIESPDMAREIQEQIRNLKLQLPNIEQTDSINPKQELPNRKKVIRKMV